MADDFSYTGSPPLTFADITALLQQIEAGKQRILCAPDVFERVRDAVYSAGYGAYFKVLENQLLDDGQVVVAQSESEQEAEMQVSGQRMMDELVAEWERERRAAEFVCRSEYLYGVVIHKPGPFSPVITGI
jgi:hypothetical protein